MTTLEQSVREQLGNSAAVLFSLDTTGSMAPCIQDVREKLQQVAEQAFRDIPGLHLGVIAHGDYCDGPECLRLLDLTADAAKVVQFLAETPNTNGGDIPECYELVFREALREISWPADGGSLVLVGDAFPHALDANPSGLDWKAELAALLSSKIRVFPVQCLRSEQILQQNQFWEEVARLSGTPLLYLNDFKETTANLGAVAYAAAGLESPVSIGSSASLDLSSNIARLNAYLKSR